MNKMLRRLLVNLVQKIQQKINKKRGDGEDNKKKVSLNFTSTKFANHDSSNLFYSPNQFNFTFIIIFFSKNIF